MCIFPGFQQEELFPYQPTCKNTKYSQKETKYFVIPS